MAADDIRAHAINASQDFYELLGIPESASESEIRSAYRKTALKYHPDKVGANQEALDKFHALQIAYDILSDENVKALYDNARRAKVEKKARDAAYEGRRKQMKEELERRESGAFKRKRDEVDAQEAFDRELRRLAEDGKRRRKEREEQLRREIAEAEQKEASPQNDTPQRTFNGNVDDLDRSITCRFLKGPATADYDKGKMRSLFSRFGPVEEVVLREKKAKVEGEKHRQLFVNAVIVFERIVGAHAAMSDFAKLAGEEPDTYGLLQNVSWARGKEPSCVPKQIHTPAPKSAKLDSVLASTPATPQTNTDSNGAGLKKVPSFASFKGSATPSASTPSSNDTLMMRLKNAERKRLEEKRKLEEQIRLEDEHAAA